MNFDLEPKERRRRSFLSRAGYLTVVFVVLANVAGNCLTRVGFAWQTVWRISTECLLYLLSVYAVFCAMGDTGRRDASAGAAYVEARAACERWVQAARPYRSRLGAFVTRLLADDLCDRRTRALESTGLSMADYTAGLCRLSRRRMRRAGYDRAQRGAVVRARRMRPARLECAWLYETDTPHTARRMLVSPERRRVGRYSAALGPTTLFALFSVQVVFAVEVNRDPRAVLVACLLRVGLLAWTALRGYTTGERSILCDSVRYYTVKAHLLEDFVLSETRNAPARLPAEPASDTPTA